MHKKSKQTIAILLLILFICLNLNLQLSLKLNNLEWIFKVNNPDLIDEYDSDKMLNSPLIFIGGYPRSGTTLMRAILDVHPSVSCGPETKIIHPLLRIIRNYKKEPHLSNFSSLGYENKSLDSATSLFIYHILENHIRIAERLCAKDPDILYYMEYLHQLFPKAKFLYMLRDGRAAAFSLMNRIEVYRSEFIFLKYLNRWNLYNENYYKQCMKVGEQVCLMVRYEKLVLRPKETIEKVAKFLGLSWTDDFLRHDEFVDKKISISSTEWSSKQVKSPIYTKSIKNWLKYIRLNKTFTQYAPMLRRFGYINNDVD